MIVLCLSFCHQLNQSEFQDMDDETRAQYEGFRPGVYVRVEVRLVYVIPFTLFSYYSLSLSAQLRRSWRFPVVLTVDLHALPRVLCQGTNFVRKGGVGRIWIDQLCSIFVE